MPDIFRMNVLQRHKGPTGTSRRTGDVIAVPLLEARELEVKGYAAFADAGPTEVKQGNESAPTGESAQSASSQAGRASRRTTQTRQPRGAGRSSQ